MGCPGAGVVGTVNTPMRVLGIEVGPLEEQEVLLATKPSL